MLTIEIRSVNLPASDGSVEFAGETADGQLYIDVLPPGALLPAVGDSVDVQTFPELLNMIQQIQPSADNPEPWRVITIDGDELAFPNPEAASAALYADARRIRGGLYHPGDPEPFLYI